MAYIDTANDRRRRMIAAGASAAVQAAAIAAVVTGLAVHYTREETTVVVGRNIPLDPPPPPEPKPQAEPRERVADPSTSAVPRDPLPLPADDRPLLPGPLPLPDPGPFTLPDPGPTVRPEPGPMLARAARPRSSPGAWAGPADYPARDLREGNEGTTRFVLDIGGDGRVRGCTVTLSSGHPGLDEATCRNLQRRGRFEPARDAAGNPVAASWGGSIRWTIPRE